MKTIKLNNSEIEVCLESQHCVGGLKKFWIIKTSLVGRTDIRLRRDQLFQNYLAAGCLGGKEGYYAKDNRPAVNEEIAWELEITRNNVLLKCNSLRDIRAIGVSLEVKLSQLDFDRFSLNLTEAQWRELYRCSTDHYVAQHSLAECLGYND